MTRGFVLALMLLLQQPETLSLLGDPLYPPKLPKAARAAAEAELARAHAAYMKNPSAPAEILALERAHVALGRIGDALIILSHGIEVNPADASLLLERGRGYIVIRKFDLAERDLSKAAATLPAARCALALAQYLTGDYPRARVSFGECGERGTFGYLAERRAGGTPAARPAPDGALPTTPPPLRLPGAVKKDTTPASQPIAAMYLAAIDRLLAGDQQAARVALKKIVDENRSDWMEPAYIAAEADYARLKLPEKKKKKT
jgi:tetratricopeptide (TPR) repeat protein